MLEILKELEGMIKENVSFKILENHPADSRLKICDDGIFQTLSSRMGTGGGAMFRLLWRKKWIQLLED